MQRGQYPPERRRELRTKLSLLANAESVQAPRDRLDEILARTQRACDAVQAELLVVILPLDVQVSKDEWQKYGQTPIDMSATGALNQDVAERAKRIGARVLDATPSLRAAEPGAFLKGDLHMSSRGHRAVAGAIAAAWREPLPQPTSLSEGRTALPASDEWHAVEASVAAGDAPADCSVTRVREWWRVACRRPISAPYPEVSSLALVRGGRGDAIADLRHGRPTPAIMNRDDFESSDAALQLIAPLLQGDVLELQLEWSQFDAQGFRPDHARTLRIEGPNSGGSRVEWGPSLPPAAANALQPESVRAIVNHVTIPHDLRCEERQRAEYDRLRASRSRIMVRCTRSDRGPPCRNPQHRACRVHKRGRSAQRPRTRSRRGHSGAVCVLTKPLNGAALSDALARTVAGHAAQ